MKRILSWRSFELLEQKRLKAADLAECPDVHEPVIAEAADATPGRESIEAQMQAGNLEIPMSLSESSDADESGDDSDNDDSDENDMDEMESDDDADDGDESNDDESDADDSDEGDDDPSDENDTDENDTDEDDSDDDDDDDMDDDDSDDDDMDDDMDDDDSDENDTDMDDSDEGDNDSSDENDTDEDDSDDDSDDVTNPPTSAPIVANGNAGSTIQTPDVLAASSVSRSFASAAPAANVSKATAVDQNLLNVVYAPPEKLHDSGEHGALLERDTTEQSDPTDAVFEQIASNPLTWPL